MEDDIIGEEEEGKWRKKKVKKNTRRDDDGISVNKFVTIEKEVKKILHVSELQ